MELNSFVARSLFEIADGVRQANDLYAKSKETTPPPATPPRPFELEATGGGRSTSLVDAHYVEFDVAVTAGTEAKDKAGAGVGITVLQLGVGGESSKSNETVSRISFKVRIGQSIY